MLDIINNNRREVVKKISKSTFDFKGRRWSTISSQAKDFVTELLIKDPTERPTAEEARKALWVNTGQSSFSSMRTDEGMAVVNESMERYSALKILQKLALMVIAHKSTSEEIGFLRKAFKRYDSEQDGTISLVEFKKCLSVHEYSESYMEHLFREMVSSQCFWLNLCRKTPLNLILFFNCTRRISTVLEKSNTQNFLLHP